MQMLLCSCSDNFNTPSLSNSLKEKVYQNSYVNNSQSQLQTANEKVNKTESGVLKLKNNLSKTVTYSLSDEKEVKILKKKNETLSKKKLKYLMSLWRQMLKMKV